MLDQEAYACSSAGPNGPAEGPTRKLVHASIVEPDALKRVMATQAGLDLGFLVAAAEDADAEAARPTVRFIGLDRIASCPRLGSAVTACTPGGEARGAVRCLTVGYVAGAGAVLAGHALHACTDMVVALTVLDGRPAFCYPSDWALSAVCAPLRQLTPREADVLLLIMAGSDTSAVASQLWVSEATVRSHCRSILRKCGAPDRRALRSRLLADHSAFE